MGLDLPIACSLEGAAFDACTDEGAKVLADVTSRETIEGGVELRFATTPRDHLQVLVDRERECCPWMSMEIAEADDWLSLSISSGDPIGERQIHEWFGA